MNDTPKSIPLKKAVVIAIAAFIAGLLVMLLALEVIVPLVAAPKASEFGIVPEEIAVNTPEWFAYERTYSDKQALIDIGYSENPVKLIADSNFEGGYGWFYSIYFTEMNGYDFYPESYQENFFCGNEICSSFSYSADDLIMWWGESRIAANDQKIVRGGLPQQDISGIGIKVTGKDADGNALEFCSYLEFSEEISE